MIVPVVGSYNTVVETGNDLEQRACIFCWALKKSERLSEISDLDLIASHMYSLIRHHK